ncbi:MAG: alpha/beta fold hydrolase [Treponema sp.]|jgi:pimeloyl-ACP methyl ester carboxylesterase/putative flippase GtrA|nr:alpha/beta fold hydrolase [Treponema sp.]
MLTDTSKNEREIWKFIKFLFAAGGGVVIELLTHFFLISTVFKDTLLAPLPQSPLLRLLQLQGSGTLYAFLLSTAAGLAASFVFNRKITFKADANMALSVTLYMLMGVFTVLMSAWLGTLMNSRLVAAMPHADIEIPGMIAKVIMAVLPIVWTYPLNRFVIHRRKKAPDTDGECSGTYNGMTLYYKKAGAGKPILLLHGNGETHEIFDVLIPQLSKTHTVYAIDARGHGKSQKINEIHYTDLADDVADFIQKEKLDKPIVYGFSDGGIVGLLLASRYPDLLGKLIASGANATPRGLKTWIWVVFKLLYFFTRDYRTKMMFVEPNLSAQELGRITAPTMLLVGERDVIRQEHTQFIYQSIAKNNANVSLRILPKEGHISYVAHSKKLYPILQEYLDPEIG